MKGKWIRVLVMGTLAAVLMVGVGGCASTGDTGASSGSAIRGIDSVPASSPLSRIKSGMTEVQVRKILGEPDNSNSYMTGKAWIPFYFGGDTHRVDWIYNGTGRVVFSRNQWSGSVTVVDLVHDPS